jgi:TPR repeat protein
MTSFNTHVFKLAIVFTICNALSGCAALVIEGAALSHTQIVRQMYEDDAKNGDAEAQYLVGSSYCCTNDFDEDGLYNTRLATEYLCASAKQGHAPAALLLGDIHIGNHNNANSMLLRALQALKSSESATDTAIALYWYSEAKKRGNKTAEKILKEFNNEVVLDFPVSEAPCTIEEVYLDAATAP